MVTGNEGLSEPPSVEGADKKPVIVAMGASAGGVQALQSFFNDLPSDTGAAFIVVVHLDPERAFFHCENCGRLSDHLAAKSRE